MRRRQELKRTVNVHRPTVARIRVRLTSVTSRRYSCPSVVDKVRGMEGSAFNLT
jgi:hypothetical protein